MEGRANKGEQRGIVPQGAVWVENGTSHIIVVVALSPSAILAGAAQMAEKGAQQRIEMRLKSDGHRCQKDEARACNVNESRGDMHYDDLGHKSYCNLRGSEG